MYKIEMIKQPNRKRVRFMIFAAIEVKLKQQEYKQGF
jgi:hypothetical protein